jgi:hypothetical protein
MQKKKGDAGMSDPNFLHRGETCRLSLGVAGDQGTR